MRRKLAGLLIAMMTFSLAACGNNASEDEQHEHSHTEVSGLTLRVGVKAHDGEPAYEALEQFAQEVESRTKGDVKISILSQNEIDSEEEELKNLVEENSELDMLVVDLQYLSKYVPSMNVSHLPYVVNGFEDVEKLRSSDVRSEAEANLKSFHIQALTYYSKGFHCLLTDKNVKENSDLQGLRIGLSNDNMSAMAMKVVGAVPMELTISEATGKLQQGAIDGYEGLLEDIYENRMYQFQDYLVMMNHTYNASCLVVSSEAWEHMSVENQEIVRNAAMSSYYKNDQLVKQDYNNMIREIESAGVRVVYPDYATFWEKSKTAIRGYATDYGTTVDRLMDWKQIN